MSKNQKSTHAVRGAEVTVLSQGQQDLICLTDIAKYKNSEHPDDVIRNWLRNRNTVEFLGVWERLNNPGFNPVEFDGIRIQTGLNSFVLTPKQWIEKTGAVGLISNAGRYGGTYAHKDSHECLSGLSPVRFLCMILLSFCFPHRRRPVSRCLPANAFPNPAGGS